MSGIAISGRAGSGKSALAALLQDWLGGPDRSRICPVAEPLKTEVLLLFGLTKADPGGRDKLISHGDAQRLRDPHYWIRRFARNVNLAAEYGKLAIIDDVRFPAELDWARERGMLTVRVYAPESLRRSRLASLGLDPNFAVSTDVGETSLDHVTDWDVGVVNDGPEGLLNGARRVLTLLRRQGVKL